MVTSNPEGARVVLENKSTWEETEIGLTPVSITIPAKTGFYFVFVTADDYKRGWTLVSAEDTTIHFDLEESWLEKIFLEFQEREYPNDFKKKIFDILSTCEKAAEGPSSLLGIMHPEANNQLNQLKVDYPEMKDYAIVKALEKCVRTIRSAAIMDVAPMLQSEYIYDLRIYIMEIKNPLELGL